MRVGVRDRAMELAFILADNPQHHEDRRHGELELELGHVDHNGNENDDGVVKNDEGKRDSKQETLDDEQPKQQHQQPQKLASTNGREPVLRNFVIGISGAPSSGKTTLSLLLDVVLEKALRQLTPDAGPGLPPQNAVVHQDDYGVKQEEVGQQKQKQEAAPEEDSSTAAAVAAEDCCDEYRIGDYDEYSIGGCDFELLARHLDELDAGAHPAAIMPDQPLHSPLNELLPDAVSALRQLSPGTLKLAVTALRNALSDTLSEADEAKRDLASDDVRLGPHGTAPRVARRFAIVEGPTLLARDAAAQDPVGRVAPGSEAHALRETRRVQDRFDACLFLPSSMPEARRRRWWRRIGLGWEDIVAMRRFELVTWCVL